MAFDSYTDDANFPDDALTLPCAPAPPTKEDGGRCKRPLSPDVVVDVMDSGLISRAPVPVDQAEKLEMAAGAEEGAYFVELMRKRLQCVHDIQVRWVTRTCNKKKPKYVDTQAKLRDFAGWCSKRSRYNSAHPPLRWSPLRQEDM